MIKYYESIEEALQEYNFDVMSTNIVGTHLMSRCIKTDKYYICHFEITVKGYIIDNCKPYNTKDEALLVLIALLAKEYQGVQNETSKQHKL